MTFKRKISFSLTTPENTKQDGNLPSTRNLNFNDLSEFVEEREKIKRLLESKLKTELKIDYSDFSNHVFFDSAYEKLTVGINKLINYYPYNKNYEDRDAFFMSASRI